MPPVHPAGRQSVQGNCESRDAGPSAGLVRRTVPWCPTGPADHRRELDSPPTTGWTPPARAPRPLQSPPPTSPEQTDLADAMNGTPGRLQLVLVDSHGRGGRRQVVKAAACGAAIRGFESPRSPSKILQQNYLTCNFELKNHKKFLAKC